MHLNVRMFHTLVLSLPPQHACIASLSTYLTLSCYFYMMHTMSQYSSDNSQDVLSSNITNRPGELTCTGVCMPSVCTSVIEEGNQFCQCPRTSPGTQSTQYNNSQITVLHC